MSITNKLTKAWALYSFTIVGPICAYNNRNEGIYERAVGELGENSNHLYSIRIFNMTVGYIYGTLIFGIAGPLTIPFYIMSYNKK